MSKNKIGKNIREIRKAYGETQTELGIAINVENNTISMYESGQRQPDIHTIQVIAEHYGFPVDRLIDDDFSEMNLKIDTLTWEKMISILQIMFPIICTESAMQDEHFAKGYEYTIRIWEAIKKNNGSLMDSSFEQAFDEYQISLAESEIIESAANMLWITFIVYSLLPDEHSLKIGEAVLYGKAQKKDFVKKYVLKDSNRISKENEDIKKAYAKESYENRMILLKFLKESDNYSTLADYYLALQYIMGIAGNEYGEDLNKTIGMEMMMSFLSFGNPYAITYIKEVVSL